MGRKAPPNPELRCHTQGSTAEVDLRHQGRRDGRAVDCANVEAGLQP
jgi:hypothetical protein